MHGTSWIVATLSITLFFSDECSISLQQYQRTCYRKIDEPMKWKPKPKHPLKVHVWAGINRHGATEICIFDGIMDADLFCNILESTLVLFIREKLPDHRFMQDNDLKHTSRNHIPEITIIAFAEAFH